MRHCRLEMCILLLLMCVGKVWAEFTSSYVTKNGVVYQLSSTYYLDGIYASAYSLADNFTGTSVVIANTVEAIWRDNTSGAEETINIPVTSISLSSPQITSLTLPSNLTQEYLASTLRYFDNLEEVIIQAGNPNYSSNHGLLCDAAGATLLYVPKKSYQISDGILTIPMGIHYDNIDGGDNHYYNYGVNRVRYQDELYHWPTYTSREMWFEKNMTPPEGHSESSYYDCVILHIPTGCLDAYSVFNNGIGGIKYILEEGANIDIVNENLKGSGFYDVDGDGELDVVGRSSDFSSQATLEVYQNPNTDNLTYNWGGAVAYIGENGIFVYPIECYSGVTLYEDIDGDGLRDCIATDPQFYGELRLSKQQKDGSFIITEQNIIDKDEVKESGGRMPNLRDAMFLGDGGDLTLTAVNIARDVNGDGILDLMDPFNGGIYYSDGDNQWMKYSTKTLIWPCDIDADGQEDFVIYDGEAVSLITDRFSASPNKKELFRGTKVEKVLIKDFDNDGDLDILLHYTTGGSSASPNYTHYFIFLRNNGNGTFRKKESNFVEDVNYRKYNLSSCGDYDNDGLYELAMFSSGTYISPGKLLKINSDLTVTEHPESFVYGGIDGTVWRKPVFGDFDNDGWTEWYANIDVRTIYGHMNSQTTQNTAPQKMAKPTAVLQPETGWLKIMWQRGSDAETSACDLTYELRIGTAPGKDDIVRPASLADGRRRTLREGELGTSLYRLFNANTLKPGKYYIAVQAIDAGGLGGAFSDEFVYEHYPMNPSFTFTVQNPSTADVIQVNIKAAYQDATYEWQLSEGEVIEQNAGDALIQFHQMGNHTVTLVMTLDGAVYRSEPQTIFVDAAKVFYPDNGYNYYDSDFNMAFDINQDGYPEYVGYQNDTNGNLTRIPLSLFSENLGYVCFVTDYDRDGYPDFVTSGSSKGNLFLNYGEQDFDFDYLTVDTSFPECDFTADFNNDGRTDVGRESGFLTDCKYDAGDGLTYNSLMDDYFNGSFFYDVNHDGFLDIVARKAIGSTFHQSDEVWTVRYKDNTANMAYGEEQELFRIPMEEIGDVSYGSGYLADMNNDGVVDLVFDSGYYKDSTVYIIHGVANGIGSDVIKVKGVAYATYNASSLGIGRIRDINDDGTLDIVLEGSSHQIIHMNSDGNYEVVNMSQNAFIFNGGPWMVTKDGGYPQSHYYLNGSIRNAKPSAPTTVAAKQTADGMLISWADAADDHTPAVQMRYNISVKRKGKTGPGAYIISPMNGESDVATIVSNYLYKQSTQMLVPASVLTAGETYEIRVQAIDLWNEVSPMTAPIEFTMGSGGHIDVAERVATGRELTVKYVGAQASSYSINAGQDGQVVQNLGGGQYTLKWSTPGVKQISITAGGATVASSVTVVNSIALDFTVPATVFAGAPLSITLTDEMASLSSGVGLRCSDPKVEIDYTNGDKTAMVTFPATGTYTLETYSTDEMRGGTYQRTVTVAEMMPEATIKRVDVTGNCYYVQWDASSLPSSIDRVIVLRESNSLNQFDVVSTVDASQGYYIDASSNALVTSNRYGIMLVASNGQTSAMSTVHKPLHVMLGSSAMGGYNLMWNSYEGLTVDNYQIWRGSSPEQLQLYAQVAGSQQSYTDLTPLAGTSYYSIVFNPQAGNMSRRRAPGNNDGSVHSNYVSTQGATSLVLAESIEISNATDVELTVANPDIRLYCSVLPVYCTVNNVSWSIVEGSDIATIDSDGRLHASGSGTVKVRATTIDGSNLSTEATITCRFSNVIRGDANGDGRVTVTDIGMVVNHILQLATAGYSEEGADANGDGKVTVTDIGAIVNIILGISSQGQ